MKTKNLVLTLAAVSLALGTTQLVADADQPWHVTGQVGTINLDDSRNLRTDDVWWSVGFGRYFGNNLSLDLEFDQFEGTVRDDQASLPESPFGKWRLRNVGVMGRYHFGQSKVRPYLGVGLGSLKHRNSVDSSSALSAAVAAGLQGQFSKHLSGRMQIMWRGDGDDKSQQQEKSYTDWIFSIGLNFDFGGKDAPPPPRHLHHHLRHPHHPIRTWMAMVC